MLAAAAAVAGGAVVALCAVAVGGMWGAGRIAQTPCYPTGACSVAAVVGTHPVRPCTCTMRPTQVPELPVAGPHAPRGPTRSLGWAGGG